jgi:hypothetical protein
MAQVVTTVDDLDNRVPAEETIRFAVNGDSYEIDLGPDNAQQFRALLHRYMQAGRPIKETEPEPEPGVEAQSAQEPSGHVSAEQSPGTGGAAEEKQPPQGSAADGEETSPEAAAAQLPANPPAATSPPKKRAAATRSTGPAKQAGSGKRSSETNLTSNAIREWARRNGLAVNDRGRIPAKVQEAFNLAHGPKSRRQSANKSGRSTAVTAVAV